MRSYPATHACCTLLAQIAAMAVLLAVHVGEAATGVDRGPDILWRHAVSGASTIWQMDGFTRTAARPLPVIRDINWQVTGTGDYNGDGKSDIQRRHADTGQNTIWLMDGVERLDAQPIPGEWDKDWHVGGTGDYNGDGNADILWRHAVTGANAIWLMDRFTPIASQPIFGVGDTDWQVVGSGDHNGDGKADILWRHGRTGRTVIWLMDGFTRTAGQSIWVGDINWQVVGSGDHNGDGKADILWRHGRTGRTVIWLMDGFTRTAAQPIWVGDINWQVVGTGDHNGDGKSDILWRHGGTGQNVIWLMDGFTRTAAQPIPRVSDTDWKVVGIGNWSGQANGPITTQAADGSRNGPPTVVTPSIIPDGGTFTEPVMVNLDSATPGATIYYTLDGTTPTPTAIAYGGAFVLTSSATVRTVAMEDGFNDSAIASAQFTITALGNQSPVLDSIGSKTVTEGQTLNLTANVPVGVEQFSSACHPEPGSDQLAQYFKIMVIADTHIDGDAGGGGNWDELEDIAINLQDPDGVNEYLNIQRVVVVGDVVSATLDRSHTFSRIEKAKEIMDRLWWTYRGPVPYAFVMGNHDYKLDNDDDSDRVFLPEELLDAEARWMTTMHQAPEQPWQPYWQQIHNGWKFIYLSSFRGNTLSGVPNRKFRHFDDQQIGWLRCELSSGHKIVIFMHHPLDTDDRNNDRWADDDEVIDEGSDPEFMDLIFQYRNRVEAIFVGHGHHFESDKLYNEIKVKEVGAIAQPTPDCDHPKFIVEGRPIGHNASLAPVVEVDRECE
jgi:hypothetical protein